MNKKARTGAPTLFMCTRGNSTSMKLTSHHNTHPSILNDWANMFAKLLAVLLIGEGRLRLASRDCLEVVVQATQQVVERMHVVDEMEMGVLELCTRQAL